MDVLHDAEIQLQRVVATLQQKLLTGNDFLPADPANSSAAVNAVLNSIESLQDELRDCARQIAARATQPSESRHENLSVGGAEETLGSETETEDEGLPCRQAAITTSEEEDEMELKIERYSQSVARIVAIMDEDTQDIRSKIASFELDCGAAMATFVMFIKNGELPSDETAAAFRDATLLLPGIVSRLHKQKYSGAKRLTRYTIHIKSVLDLARDNPELPRSLADPLLEATHVALNQLKEVLYASGLQKMENTIHATKSNPDSLGPDHITDDLNLLLIDFQRTFRQYSQQQRSGRYAPWTEEQWSRFATISSVLEEWIRLAAQVSPKPKLRGIFSKFDRQIRGFA